ncbi:MAG: hypothetical protein JO011_11965, partial [Ktedonobacteraceae bacterium]|nr:hypothetical protein [Ktedonobacteraceae bacterium]
LKTVWLIAGFLLLLAIIVVASALSRLRDGRGRRRKGNRHAGKGDYNEHERSHKKPASATKDRKDALMHELLELDKEFEAGKLSKATYQERRARIKARLRTLMSEQEAPRR